MPNSRALETVWRAADDPVPGVLDEDAGGADRAGLDQPCVATDVVILPADCVLPGPLCDMCCSCIDVKRDFLACQECCRVMHVFCAGARAPFLPPLPALVEDATRLVRTHRHPEDWLCNECYATSPLPRAGGRRCSGCGKEGTLFCSACSAARRTNRHCPVCWRPYRAAAEPTWMVGCDEEGCGRWTHGGCLLQSEETFARLARSQYRCVLCSPTSPGTVARDSRRCLRCRGAQDWSRLIPVPETVATEGAYTAWIHIACLIDEDPFLDLVGRKDGRLAEHTWDTLKRLLERPAGQRAAHRLGPYGPEMERKAVHFTGRGRRPIADPAAIFCLGAFLVQLHANHLQLWGPLGRGTAARALLCTPTLDAGQVAVGRRVRRGSLAELKRAAGRFRWALLDDPVVRWLARQGTAPSRSSPLKPGSEPGREGVGEKDVGAGNGTALAKEIIQSRSGERGTDRPFGLRVWRGGPAPAL